jgi:tRNA(Ile)-lysidine synthase
MISNTLARSARHCAESEKLLEEFSINLLANYQGSNNKTLSVKKLLTLEYAQRRLLLRTWIRLKGFALPNTSKMNALCHEVLNASSDRNPRLTWGEVEVRRYRDNLYLFRQLHSYETNMNVLWEIPKPLLLVGVGNLLAEQALGVGLKANLQQVYVRFRQGGERVLVPGRGHHRTLKNLFQEWGIPIWERQRIPLLFVGDRCIAIVGFFIDERYSALPNELGYLPRLCTL